MANTTILITGAGGFLGSHLAERALKDGHRVIGIDNFCTGQRANIETLSAMANDRFRFVELDVCQDWSSALSNSPIDSAWLSSLETVFHFASPASPPHYQRLGLETLWVNSIGLRNSIAFADAHNARVVFSSTSEVYGDPQVPVQNESYRGWVNTVGPRSCYDEAKRFGESLIYTHNLKHGTRHHIVRIFNTYGPRMNPNDGRVIINFLIQAMAGQDLTVYGTGLQTRSFCFVDDLVEGIWRFSRQDGNLGPMNIGNATEFSVLEVARIVQDMFSGRPKIVYLPPLPDDPQKRLPDLALAKKTLNWQPEISLRDGLTRMREWFEGQSRQ